MTRPTAEDEDALELLLANDRIDPGSAEFLETLQAGLALSPEKVWSIKQCAWFDSLCQRYIQ